ncbi:MAG: hypothetical protein VW405_18040 [Rhodospirillaceae bacterium]
MANDNVPDIEWVDDDEDGDAGAIEWVDEQPAQPKRKGFVRWASDLASDVGSDVLEQAKKGTLGTAPWSPQNLARLAGEEVAALAARNDIPGGAKLYEWQTGQKFLSPSDLAALRAQDPQAAKRAEDRQMSTLESGVTGAVDLWKAGEAFAESDEKGKMGGELLRELPRALVEGPVRTAARGTVRREAPVSSLLDLAPAAQGGKSIVDVTKAAARSAGLPVAYPVGRLVEETGRGFGRQSLRARAEDIADEARKAMREKATTQAKLAGDDLKADFNIKQIQLKRLRGDEKADPLLRAAEKGEKAHNTARTDFLRAKDLRASRDPRIASAASASGNTRVGLADDIMRLDKQIEKLRADLGANSRLRGSIPNEAAKAELQALEAQRRAIGAKHIRNLREAIKSSPDTPKVEAARRGMYDARRVAREAQEKAIPVRDDYAARIGAADDALAQAEKTMLNSQEATNVALVQQGARANKLLEAAGDARTNMVDNLPQGSIPSRAVSGTLGRFARAVPGERNVVDESMAALGGEGVRGAVAGAAGLGIGTWARNADAMQKVAATLIRNGRAMRDTQQIVGNISAAGRSGGRALALQAVREMLDAGQLSPQEAAQVAQELEQ